jgi:hypothetical protein|tara:strand:+ start:5478 stop:6248 length:771 start_codon:yes stop_codon:yes gene_type:complete
MTDSSTVVSVTFSQKVSEAPYETADYTLSITRTYPDSFDDESILIEAEGLFNDIKTEVLKQAGQEVDLSESGVVMRTLKSGVARPDRDPPSVAAAPTQGHATAAPPSAPVGPTAQSMAAAPMGGAKVYPRVDFCVGKESDTKQAAWNLLAFQPHEWADDGGGVIKVYDVKEHADGSTDRNANGKNFPNFSVTAEALNRIGVGVARNVGLWVNEGDSNVPMKVWDQAGGQAKSDAVDFQWEARRTELQAFTFEALRG